MDLKERLEEFLRREYEAKLYELAKEGGTSLVIDFSVLDRFDPLLADELLEQPSETLEAFQEALKNIDLPEYSKIAIRIRNLPKRKEVRIRSLRSRHIGKLLCVEGVVKSASEVMPQIYDIIYKCPDCGALIEVKQDGTLIKKPNFCECGRRTNFDVEEEKKMDVRWLRISEPFEIAEGEKPGEIAVFLKDDLTTTDMQRRTDPGNRLKIVGIIKELPKRIKGKKTTKMNLMLEANYVEPSEKEFEDIKISEEDVKKIKSMANDPLIFEKLTQSIAPAIYGYDEIKQAIILQMFGGVEHRLPDKTKVRGNIHILITGDPGVAKSQLLKLVADIMPRGKYASGKGVTGAGLTATVRKDEELGGWVLEAGALVLANKGLMSIDEFDKMNKDDQIAMHEAMSLETISIAKASITATLPARTAILAAANPSFGRFDPMMSIIEQIKIPETLMSRFDLKFALRDIPDKERDEEIANHILKSRTDLTVATPVIPTDLLRKYIAYAKKNYTDIELTEEAANRLKNFYVDMRNKYTGEEAGVVSITLRQYEALIRLAEASAKLRLDKKVRLEDAERAIKLMSYSLRQLGYEEETGVIDIDRIESGVTTSQRSKIGAILAIIEELEKEEEQVSVEDIKAEAETRGIKDADSLIEKLKKEGIIFEPKYGYVKRL
ncbi:MAG: minichromosome maintenance protein MCM [Candidatus Aenigmarchaeota archaeon]|nr:minichromosome maintenance protein MCM [Candidatus Aenigmarchaeota archaeon]